MVFCIVGFSRQEESFEFLKIHPAGAIATLLYRRFGECQLSAINDSEESTENSEQLLEFESRFEKRRVSVNEKPEVEKSLMIVPFNCMLLGAYRMIIPHF